MNKIICPVDFSDAAKNAIEFAANIASLLNAEITLFHVITEPTHAVTDNVGTGFFPMEEREKIQSEQLNSLCQATNESFDVECHPVLRKHGTGFEKSIKKEIQKGNYDLVVMGTNGADDVKQLFLGSHTYSLMRKISTPLLLVPEGCPFQSLQKVVYASDYQTEDLGALYKLMELTKGFYPDIRILHVSKSKSEKSKEVFYLFEDLYKDKLDTDRVSFHHLQSDTIPEALDSYMNENKGELLVLLTRHYSFIEKIFHNSVTKKMSMLANYPILIEQAES